MCGLTCFRSNDRIHMSRIDLGRGCLHRHNLIRDGKKQIYFTFGFQGQELLTEKDSGLSLRGVGSGSGLSLRGEGSGSGLSLRGEGSGSGLSLRGEGSGSGLRLRGVGSHSGLTLHIAASGRHHAGVYICQADNGWGHLANATVSVHLLILI